MELTRRDFLLTTASAATLIAVGAGCPIVPAPPRDEYPFPYHHDGFGGDGNVTREQLVFGGALVTVAWARPRARLELMFGVQGTVDGVRLRSDFGDGGEYTVGQFRAGSDIRHRVRAIFGELIVDELHETLGAVNA